MMGQTETWTGGREGGRELLLNLYRIEAAEQREWSRERQRARLETSQAHRQTLNPIARAGSRKRAARDAGRGGGCSSPVRPHRLCSAHRLTDMEFSGETQRTQIHKNNPLYILRLSPLHKTPESARGGGSLKSLFAA
ncbi:hypothetical protein Q5P01_017805 [Channa striata]|uniref:Uncharacterized protein n=1 Tax=Channa striata TaxID=64152 RepID=A0AA88SE83_CHASR|nr:hypothetical protein Q5P01_017805 [Channa striata]